MKLKKINLTLQTRILILVCIVVLAVLFVSTAFVADKVSSITKKHLEDKAMDTAHIIANSPIVIDGLVNKEKEKNIQTFTTKIKDLTNLEFIVVTDINGIRKSHPDLSKINKKIVGEDTSACFKGSEYISTSEGTLGKSLRAFVPIFNDKGIQVGIVAVGILTDNVKIAVNDSSHAIFLGINIGFLVGLIGAIILAKNIKRILFGLEPSAIAKLLKERIAMIKSVREGVLAIDNCANITLVSDEAIRIFNKAGIYGNPIGKNVTSFVPNTKMNEVLKSGKSALDQEQDLNGVILITNRIPIIVNNKIEGVIATFRDKTELTLLAEQLTSVKLYADALRAQTHEFMNKLHVILGMIHMKCYDELSKYIKSIANAYQVEVGFVVRHIKDPALAGFVLGKLSYARENNIDFCLSEESFIPEPKDSQITHELITIIGNLVDNAIYAVKDCKEKFITLELVYNEKYLYIKVQDTGIGINDDIKEKIFLKGFSTKQATGGFGLFLVKSSVDKLNGELSITSEPNEGTIFDIYLPYKSKDDVD